MGLFGGSRPVVISAGRGSRRSGIPRWLMLVLLGAAMGGAGIVGYQQHFGPPMLSLAESTRLVHERDQARLAGLQTEAALRAEKQTIESTLKAEKLAVQQRLEQTGAELARVRGDLERLTASTQKSTETIERLTRDLALYEEVLPPDPRGNPVGVRAARLERAGDRLAYHVLLTREDGKGTPFTGMMQLVVTGQRASGGKDSVTLGPVPVKVGAYQHVKGSLPLPKGFNPHQTSVQVLDKPEGTNYGMRIINVQ